MDKEFLNNVRLMRFWQKEYFKTRSQQALEASKQYERLVDQYVDDIYEPKLELI